MNPTVERGPPQRLKTKKLPRDKAAEKGTQTKDKENKRNKHLLCIVTICTYIFYCAFVTSYVYIQTLRTMNASTWKKAADIVAKTTSVTLQASATATTELHNLQSLLLSTLSIDDSRPLQVTYESQQPIAMSTPQATDNSETPTEAYCQILPGMTSRLYPTLVADSSLEMHVLDQQDTLQMQLSTEVDKYLQEAAAKREMDVNYFDAQHLATNTINHHQTVDLTNLENDDIPELLDNDTGEKTQENIEQYIRYNDELETIPEESNEDFPAMVQGDSDYGDTIPYIQGDSEDEQFNTAINDTSDDPIIVMGKPLTTTFVSVNVHIPTEQVACLQVTNHLREFLSHFPSESKEKAFKQIYEILQVLNAYLIDNPQQHIHCMSPDNEYVSLIMYANTIEIDLCNFPAIWAVLSILLDTQSNRLQHVKSLQQVVNNYYDNHPTDMMSELEQQASIIMKAMYDSVNNEHSDSISGDIDRVSDAVDSDHDVNDYDKDENEMPYDKDENEMPYDKDEYVTPNEKEKYEMPHNSDNDYMSDDQMPVKDDNDSETVTDEMKPVNKMNSSERIHVGKKDVVTYNRTNRILIVEKRPVDMKDIDDDFIRKYDEMYKSMEYKQTSDYYEARRHIQSTMEGDTPIKTGQNRQCIDNAKDYDKEYNRILNSVRHKLDLGPNMLLGAQQHTTVDSAAALSIQEKYKGTNDENIHIENGQYRNEWYKRAENMVPQLDGTYNVSDDSDIDSHSYLDLVSSNIIAQRTRGQKQRYETDIRAHTNKCLA